MKVTSSSEEQCVQMYGQRDSDAADSAPTGGSAGMAGPKMGGGGRMGSSKVGEGGGFGA